MKKNLKILHRSKEIAFLMLLIFFIFLCQPFASTNPYKSNMVAWGGMQMLDTTIKAIAAGLYHTVALQDDGTVVAWGDNGSGQTSTPAGLTNVKAIAAGFYHTVALKEDGTVVSWGSQYINKVPAGLSNVKAIAAGKNFTIALKEDGTVVAWGDSSSGKTRVPNGLTNTKAIAAGESFAIALKEDGTIVLWGAEDVSDWYGQKYIPADLKNVKAIAAGYTHVAVLKEDGTVVTWGSMNPLYGKPTPVPNDLSNVKAIYAGKSHTVALKGDGTIVTWGDTYSDSTFRTTTTRVPTGLTNVIAVAAANDYTIALKNDGTIVDWGDNLKCRYLNIAKSIANPEVIAIGYSTYREKGTIAAKKEDGSVAVWQYNQDCQSFILEGSSNVNKIYVQYTHDGFGLIATLTKNGTLNYGQNCWTNVFDSVVNVKSAAISDGTIIALKMDGTVEVALQGDNYYRQEIIPEGLTKVKDVAAGKGYVVALKEDGTVVVWGSTGYDLEVIPAGLSNVKAIASGPSHIVALKEDGTVVAWGANYSGETNVPAGLTNVKAIAAGDKYSVALKEDGAIIAWGDTNSGVTSIPSGLTNVKSISAGPDYCIAILNNSSSLVKKKTILHDSNLTFSISSRSLLLSRPLPTGAVISIFDVNGRTFYKAVVNGSIIKLPPLPASQVMVWRIDHPSLSASGKLLFK